MCFKPQLAVLVVPSLIAARRWQTLGWAMATAGGLLLVSLMVLGERAWGAFLADTALARAVLEQGGVGFAKMVSVFAAVRLVGVGLYGAWAAQAVASGLALLLVVIVATHSSNGRAEGALLATAACLATPFLLDYDLMLLAIPLAWVASEAERSRYLPWEKLILGLAFFLPLVARSLAMWTGVPVAPLVLIALLGVVVRRARFMGIMATHP
jgi:hypothetical protein